MLIAKFEPKDVLHVPSDVWRGTQCKSIDNRLRDFNWFVLHKKLAEEYAIQSQSNQK